MREAVRFWTGLRAEVKGRIGVVERCVLDGIVRNAGD